MDAEIQSIINGIVSNFVSNNMVPLVHNVFIKYLGKPDPSRLAYKEIQKIFDDNNFPMRAEYAIQLLLDGGGITYCNNYLVQQVKVTVVKHLGSDFLPTKIYPVDYPDRVKFSGRVNPNGNLTTVWFEWGETPELEMKTAPQYFSLESAFEYELIGLQPSTKYFYRSVATNIEGSAFGETIQFETSCKMS